MLTILIGILSSYVAELVTALNKKLTGTVLEGQAAFLIAFGISLPAAAVKEALAPGFDWHMLLDYQHLVATFSEVFAVSQLYFMFVVKKLSLDVKPAQPVATAVRMQLGDQSAGSSSGV